MRPQELPRSRTPGHRPSSPQGREARSGADPGRRGPRVSSRRQGPMKDGARGGLESISTGTAWSEERTGRGRGNHTGHRPGRAPPSARLPLPLLPSLSRAVLPLALFPPPPPSPLLGREEGGRTGTREGGWAGSFAALWSSASEAFSKTAAGARTGTRGPSAPSPPCPCRRGWDPTKSQILNDRAAGGAGEDRAARAQPGHCRFKLTCPLFGIEPMRERPLPGPSQWRGGEGGRAPPTHLY